METEELVDVSDRSVSDRSERVGTFCVLFTNGLDDASMAMALADLGLGVL